MQQFMFGDLFCGAGGTTQGAREAAQRLGIQLSGFAINHNEHAIETHQRGNPDFTHYMTGVGDVSPLSVVPGGHLDLLVASPSCTHHSRARGGKPTSDQSRADAFLVLKWLEELDVTVLLIENVPDFLTWGPVDHETGKPIEKLKGKTFRAWMNVVKSLGYRVEWRTLVCADYGDPTSRERFFLIARKDGKRIRWPEPTHQDPKAVSESKLPGITIRKPWRTAREIIRWDVPGTSIYHRKKPLCENTLRRIAIGLERFCGLPFVIGQQSCSAPRSVDSPIPTIATAGSIALVEPFIVKLYGNSTVSALDDPLPTVTAEGEHLALAQPFLIKFYGTGTAISVDDPLDTVTTKDRFGLVQPRLVQIGGDTFMVDVLYRMLLPEELAAAMSFRHDYPFVGNREQKIRQIGNAVPVNTAAALVEEIFKSLS